MAPAKPEPDTKIRLHLLRHADAGDAMEWSGDDALRPLTSKGREQSERLGRFLESRGVRPDVIATSPLVRASQTAEIVAACLGMSVRVDPRLASGFTRLQLWPLLDELGAREPMLVGHDPDFSDLIAYLIDANGISLKKGALATIDMHTQIGDGEAELRWLVPPKLLGS